MKERALSLSEKKQRIVRLDVADNRNDGENHDSNVQDEGCYYQYVVTIPTTKKMLSDLAPSTHLLMRCAVVMIDSKHNYLRNT